MVIGLAVVVAAPLLYIFKNGVLEAAPRSRRLLKWLVPLLVVTAIARAIAAMHR